MPLETGNGILHIFPTAEYFGLQSLSMQGVETVTIDGQRFEEFLRSRQAFFEVSQGVVSQGGLARILLLCCTAGFILPYICQKNVRTMPSITVYTNESGIVKDEWDTDEIINEHILQRIND